MHKFLVIETFFNEKKQNFYYVMLPDVREDGFYRAVGSFSAFFQSMRNPHANVTEVRQFTGHSPEEVKHYKHLFKFSKVDPKDFQTFDSIWDFYKFIGYDYKTRKYKSGEVKKIFNGRIFELPKRVAKRDRK